MESKPMHCRTEIQLLKFILFNDEICILFFKEKRKFFHTSTNTIILKKRIIEFFYRLKFN